MTLRAPIHAVLFDLDGVLLDTEPLYTQAIQEVVGAHGKVYDWALKRRMMGRSDREGSELLIQELALPIDASQYFALRDPIFLRLFASSPAIPGAAELVAELALRGVRLAVATSSQRALFELKARPHAWFSHFSVVVCGDDPELKALKPAPDIFLLAAARLSVPPSACLVIEDSPAGVTAAKRANIQVIALPAAELGREAVAEADCIATGYAQIARALRRVLDEPAADAD